MKFYLDREFRPASAREMLLQLIQHWKATGEHVDPRSRLGQRVVTNLSARVC
jgi:hypothetical protein